jgi:hypothetical protein
VGSTQRAWLEAQLLEAAELSEPAIVVGDANLKAQVEAHDADAVAVAEILVHGHASAYFYDATEQNVQETLQTSTGSIHVFGSGTLGYVNHVAESRGDFLGASGFLLAEVDAGAGARNPVTLQYPVTAKLIPNIAELALEAKNGTLLRRSQVASFSALARRPRAGNRSQNQVERPDTSPYIPIPSNCVGTACANGLFPEYEFSSSNPKVGNFVEPNLASGEPEAVLLEHEEPIPDPKSGLFCAYNPGTTIVTITSGGLSASLPVTVQEGSVRRPCGTVPLGAVAVAKQSASLSAPTPAPAPAPAGTAPAATPPVLPIPPAPPLALPFAPAPGVPPTPFFAPTAPVVPVQAFVLPPLPLAARPAPPTGSSPVTSPVPISETAAEEKREDEEATESASAQAAAYSAREHEPMPEYILGAVLLAAFAGACAFRRPRRDRHEVRVAPATLSTMRAQRRMTAGSRRRG